MEFVILRACQHWFIAKENELLEYNITGNALDVSNDYVELDFLFYHKVEMLSFFWILLVVICVFPVEPLRFCIYLDYDFVDKIHIGRI